MTSAINRIPTVAQRVVFRSILHTPTLSAQIKIQLLRQLQQQPKTVSSGEIKRRFITPVIT